LQFVEQIENSTQDGAPAKVNFYAVVNISLPKFVHISPFAFERGQGRHRHRSAKSTPTLRSNVNIHPTNTADRERERDKHNSGVRCACVRAHALTNFATLRPQNPSLICCERLKICGETFRAERILAARTHIWGCRSPIQWWRRCLLFMFPNTTQCAVLRKSYLRAATNCLPCVFCLTEIYSAFYSHLFSYNSEITTFFIFT
jgi:hypothetical protein